MKTQAFFELTRKVRAAQNTYYKGGRLQGDLITSKQLEAQLDKAIAAALKDGGLEPDEPTATVVVHTTEAYQKELIFLSKAELDSLLDLPVKERPTDGEGEQPT